MIVTTSDSVEGKSISEYLGVVGADRSKSTTGRDFGYDVSVESVEAELKQKASRLGADAVIAAKFDYVYGERWFGVYATGTAVKLK